MKKLMCILLLVILLADICNNIIGKNATEYTEEYVDSVPDMLGCIGLNGEYYIEVAANADVITNRESFALKVVEMFKERSFRTANISMEEGYPTGIYANVYLQKDEMEDVPYMKFTYTAKKNQYGIKYNIVEHPEEFSLEIE